MIIVTGGTGHTGCRLVQALVDRGEQVRVLTRDPAKMHLNLRRRIEVFRGDLTKPEQAAEAFKGARAVMALTHIRMAGQVITACNHAGVTRAIFMSSTRRFTRFPEETARQVIAGEETVRGSGLDWTIIRPTMIYGSRQDNNLVHLQRALQKWPIHPLPDGGRMKWQPVFTFDVVAALLAALDCSQAVGRDYTIAGPEPISYAEMVQTMMRQMKIRRLLVPIPLSMVRGAMGLMAWVSKRPLLTSDQVDRLREDKVFDITDARRDLGFNPISFEEGIHRKILGKV